MKISKFILFIFTIVSCIIAASCGGDDSFKAFQEIPDANLGGEYYEHLIEKFTQYKNIYSYLVLEQLKNDEDTILAEAVEEETEEDDSTFKLFEASYKNFQEKYPDKLAVIESYYPSLVEMTNRITSRNTVLHFETMKNVIDSYVSAVYINNYVPEIPVETEPETDENGEIVPTETTYYPPVDLDYARENITQYVSSDFLEKNPQKAVADYLNGNNIHVTRIKFQEIFSSFEHHIYPFFVRYKYDIYYYIGDEPIENEEKWHTATVTLDYYMGLDENRNYVIKYISNPAVKKEIIDAEDPKFEDFTTAEK